MKAAKEKGVSVKDLKTELEGAPSAGITPAKTSSNGEEDENSVDSELVKIEKSNGGAAQGTQLTAYGENQQTKNMEMELAAMDNTSN